MTGIAESKYARVHLRLDARPNTSWKDRQPVRQYIGDCLHRLTEWTE